MKPNPSQVGKISTKASSKPQQQKQRARAGASERQLERLEASLGPEVFKEASATWGKLKCDPGQFVRDAVARYIEARRTLDAAFPDGGHTFQLPVSRNTFSQLWVISRERNMEKDALALEFLMDGLDAHESGRGTKQAGEQGAPSASQVATAAAEQTGHSSNAAESVPMRAALSFKDRLEVNRREDDRGAGLEIRTAGMVDCSEFKPAVLLDYVCEVIERHLEYLKKLVVPELDADHQGALLEAVEYADCWHREMATHGKVEEPVRLDSLVGLAARRELSHKDLFEWLCSVLNFLQIRAVLKRHFLAEGASEWSRVEWCEVFDIARSSNTELDVDRLPEDLLPIAKARCLGGVVPAPAGGSGERAA